MRQRRQSILVGVFLVFAALAWRPLQHMDAAGVGRVTRRDQGQYWNDRAHAYLHDGNAHAAFEAFETAISFNPTEALNYEDLATCIALYRKDAREYYAFDEQQLFDKVFHLYDMALSLDPTNYDLATDIGRTYYLARPARPEQAVGIWERTLKLAHTELEREAVEIHLARWDITTGKFESARSRLGLVKHVDLLDLKENLLQRLAREDKSPGARS